MVIADVEGDHARQALAELFSTGGLDTPSLRSIARAAGVSAATLLNWFGSKGLLHVRVLDVLTERRAQLLEAELFPDDADSAAEAPWVAHRIERARADLRLRLAFTELARADQALAAALDRAVDVERLAIRRHLGSQADPSADPSSVDDAALDLMHAVLIGLWSRLCDPHRPMAAARARELWALASERIAR